MGLRRGIIQLSIKRITIQDTPPITANPNNVIIIYNLGCKDITFNPIHQENPQYYGIISKMGELLRILGNHKRKTLRVLELFTIKTPNH